VAKLALAHRRELINLTRDGFEVGCHGYVHDNKLVSLGKEDMKDSLSKAVEILKELGVKGFRSPSLLRSRQLFEALKDFFLYDSSVPDTEVFLQIAPRSGCCTVFPYLISGNLLEIPITLPLDSTLMALGFKPDSYEANRMLGEAYSKKGSYPKAIECLEKAIRTNNYCIEGYILLGDFYQKIGNIDKAIESYQCAVNINPYYADGYYSLAGLYKDKGDRINMLKQMLKLKDLGRDDLFKKVHSE